MSLFGKKESGEVVQGTEAKVRSKGSKPGYGIAETTLLMRTLPVDQNVELVVRVVRNTLESMNVQLADIIQDAEGREKSLQDRMAKLNGEIGELARQMDLRRQEIGQLEAELSETTTVKERLLLAQKLGGAPAVSAGDKPRPAPGPVPPPLPRALNGKPLPDARELAT